MNASDVPLSPRFFFFARGVVPPCAESPDFCRFVRFRFFDMRPFCGVRGADAMLSFRLAGRRPVRRDAQPAAGRTSRLNHRMIM